MALVGYVTTAGLGKGTGDAGLHLDKILLKKPKTLSVEWKMLKWLWW